VRPVLTTALECAAIAFLIPTLAMVLLFWGELLVGEASSPYVRWSVFWIAASFGVAASIFPAMRRIGA
jgi:hypothetical protein